ncbi:unnamed protein product [Heligmosomoides polygyrus]|uniref:Protein kinase domain-containing protein n=1 Tax=Heligmosomoides polygyrus TaxID=6339 RepID=A0A183GM17_HELPZ|nr:unnamed protein product [Heligmosomoides polygyrus]
MLMQCEQWAARQFDQAVLPSLFATPFQHASKSIVDPGKATHARIMKTAGIGEKSKRGVVVNGMAIHKEVTEYMENYDRPVKKQEKNKERESKETDKKSKRKQLLPAEVPSQDMIVVASDLNGHVGAAKDGYSCHGGFGYGSRNANGERILEYADSHDLTIVNTKFRKRDSHLISFYSGNAKTQIDYVLVRRRDQGVVTDAKTVPYETVATQHRPLICSLRGIVNRLRTLGKGAFGAVYAGQFRTQNGNILPVAVKSLRLVTTDKDQRLPWITEVEMTHQLNHPNVVRFFGFCTEPADSNILMIFEMMDKGALDSFCRKINYQMSVNETVDWLCQIARGMAHLHAQMPAIVHGDLAARNVLVCSHPVDMTR